MSQRLNLELVPANTERLANLCGQFDEHLKQIESRLQGKVEFVSPENDHVDFVLAVEGCKTACADLSSFQGKTIHVISRKEDVDKFLQIELLKKTRNVEPEPSKF